MTGEENPERAVPGSPVQADGGGVRPGAGHRRPPAVAPSRNSGPARRPGPPHRQRQPARSAGTPRARPVTLVFRPGRHHSRPPTPTRTSATSPAAPPAPAACRNRPIRSSSGQRAPDRLRSPFRAVRSCRLVRATAASHGATLPLVANAGGAHQPRTTHCRSWAPNVAALRPNGPRAVAPRVRAKRRARWLGRSRLVVLDAAPESVSGQARAELFPG